MEERDANEAIIVPEPSMVGSHNSYCAYTSLPRGMRTKQLLILSRL